MIHNLFRECLIEVGNNELVAVVVSGRPVDMEALKEHCRARLGPQFVPSRFLIADRLPRNDMGKIDRQKLAASLRSDAPVRN